MTASRRLHLCRSLLFLPASNGRAIEKARSLDADLMILDCEDSVKPEQKEVARAAAVAAAHDGFGGRPVAIRINAADQSWHPADCTAVAASNADYVVLPKAESVAMVDRVETACGKPVIAMIETPCGVLAAAEIGRASAALLAGTNDLAAALSIPAAENRIAFMHALQSIVIAARAAGIAVFDGVYNRLDDEAGFAAECKEGRAFGFDGKALIHPNQIATANRLFAPSEQEVAEARRLIAAAKGGAERFEGRMIESLHVAQAEATLAKASGWTGRIAADAGEAG